jgi:hypothetical protein
VFVARAGPQHGAAAGDHAAARKWVMFCAQIGRGPNWIASQIGHTDPEFTFSVYQQIATRRYVDLVEIWALLRFPDEPEQPAGGRRSRVAMIRMSLPMSPRPIRQTHGVSFNRR